MIICLLALPVLFGVTGIWLANPGAELMAVLLAFIMFIKFKKRYGF